MIKIRYWCEFQTALQMDVNSMINIKKAFIYSCLILSLSACFGFKFTYNNLDWFIPWYLDDYLVLDKQQQLDFDSNLQQLWQWHRYHELPQYSKLLNEIVIDLDQQSITLERLHYYSESTRKFYSATITKAINQGMPLITSLKDEQLSDMSEAITDQNSEFKEYVDETDLQQRIKERRKTISKLFRKWLGRLSKTQKQLIKTWSIETETSLEFRIEHAIITRVAFEKIMADRVDKKLTRGRLIELLTQPKLLQSSDFQQTIERNRKRFRHLMITTLEHSSKKQRARLRRKILSYAEDFTHLSEQKNSNLKKSHDKSN